jgi:hypothetical protein
MRLNWKWFGFMLLLVGLLHYGVLFHGFRAWSQPHPDDEPLEILEAHAITLPSPAAQAQASQPKAPTPIKPKPKAKGTNHNAEAHSDTPSLESENSPNNNPVGSATPRAETSDTNALAAEPQTPETTKPQEGARPPVLANKAPSSSLLEYFVEASVKGLSYKGFGDISWKSTATEYKTYLRFYLDFGIVETEFVRWMSEGQFDEYGLAPRRFSEKRMSRSERAAHFLPEQNKIVFSNNSPEVALNPGAQDRMSVIIQLVALAAGSPNELVPGKRFDLVTVGTSNSSELSVRVVGGDSISTSFGEVDAVKVVAKANGKYDDDLEVWLAPQYQYLPVKLRIIRTNGDVAEMTLHKKPKAI